MTENIKTGQIYKNLSNFYTCFQFLGHACQPFFLTTLDIEAPIPLKLDSKAVGELWICGDQVARGYLNRKSNEFVENFQDVVKKAYKTGDLVRLNSNNQLQFLGRCDHQFKGNLF